MAAAGTLRPALRAATYQTLLGLLGSCGLRVSEAIALVTGDFDSEEGAVTVRETSLRDLARVR